MVNSGSAPHILLLQQDPHVREECQKLFNVAGWRCELAASREDLLNSAQTGANTIIVTDMAMPAKASLEFLRSMRAQRPNEAIIVTGSVQDPKQISDWLREGAVDVVPAPVNPSQVRDSVMRLVGSMSQRAFEQNLFAHVVHAGVSFIFETHEIVGRKLPLEFLDQLYMSGRIDQGTRSRLELAFQEALANAVEHGNLELDSRWRELADNAGLDKYSLVKKRALGRRAVRAAVG